MFRGLALRLIIYLTTVVVIAEGIFAFVNVDTQAKQLLDEMVLSADLVSETVVSSTWRAMLEDQRDNAYEMMNNVGQQNNIGKVRIFNKEGQIMFSTGPDSGQVVEMNAEACDLCHAVEQPLVRVDMPSRSRVFHEAGGGRMMGMVTPIYNEPACSQADCHAHPEDITVLGVLDVTMPLDRIEEKVADVRFRAVLLSAISVILLSFFIIFFTRRLVAMPVRQLIAATKSVGALDLDKPVTIDTGDELGALVQSFNHMREQLQASQQEINNFTHTLERKVEERTKQLQATEMKLIQSDRLASLGQLAASVAHEINNPLSGVLNFAKLMQRILTDEGIPPDRVAEFRTYLDHVVTETARSGRIVTDLLAFSRRSTPQRTPHDLNEIIKKTISVISHRLELGEVVPELDLSDSLPLVTCDSSQVQQIVMNLVLNGAESMIDPGAVIIRTRLDSAGANVILEVIDSGVGIPKEHLTKIFDPFFSTKEEGKGTGLGLAVVYGIVNAHGGHIDVESRVGEGTTFRVTLPLGDVPRERFGPEA
ncbi:MAG: HAMP domain-containing protein [Candidatus Eisenbacteria bacterium]|uniref:histidine kinase n=1 Tax=Eiseniibacteriota bacterium TaxID=2212470 RepID=A0A948WC76_UNCEI|nr:HAMP domain-containing protein [Candidatus Eisenbacteria bacterium]